MVFTKQNIFPVAAKWSLPNRIYCQVGPNIDRKYNNILKFSILLGHLKTITFKNNDALVIIILMRNSCKKRIAFYVKTKTIYRSECTK